MVFSRDWLVPRRVGRETWSSKKKEGGSRDAVEAGEGGRFSHPRQPVKEEGRLSFPAPSCSTRNISRLQ